MIKSVGSTTGCATALATTCRQSFVGGDGGFGCFQIFQQCGDQQ